MNKVEQELEITEEEQQTKKTYYKMILGAKKGNKDVCLEEIPKVIGNPGEENSFKSFPFLGIRKDDDEVEEFFSCKIVKSAPWKGLMYTMLIPISAKEMLQLIKKLTVEDQFRIRERMEALESNIIKEMGNTK